MNASFELNMIVPYADVMSLLFMEHVGIYNNRSLFDCANVTIVDLFLPILDLQNKLAGIFT